MISVCMPYYRRQAALDRSLRAYEKFYSGDDIEISLCDDGSPELLQKNVDLTFGMMVHRLKPKDHALTPTTPINAAVNWAFGDTIVLTNPEIVHRASILEAMAADIKDPMDYVIAAAWDVESEKWLCHSTVQGRGGGRMPFPKGSGFHFCVMFTRALWEAAGGFDEAYRNGHGCDDNDWLWRAHSVGANFIMRDDLIVDHYKDGGATVTDWPTGGLARNKKLLQERWGKSW